MRSNRKSTFISKGLLKDNRIISLALTAIVVGLILYSGPVRALLISIITDKQVYGAGEEINLMITVNLTSGELLPINSILLNITGSKHSIISCQLPFNSSGYTNENVACSSQILTVTLIPGPSFGYGYGYGYVEWNGSGYPFGYGYGYGYESPVAAGSTSFTYIIRWKVPSEWAGDVYTASIAIIANGNAFSKSTKFSVVISQPKQTYVNETINIIANQPTIINATLTTNTTLEIVTNSSISAPFVSLAYYNETNISIPSNVRSLKKYVEIVLDPQIKNSLSWAIIKVYYTDSEVSAAGIDKSTLRLYKWSGSSWIKFDGPLVGGVNTTANYVWANVTGFSLFGVFGSLVTPTTTTSSTSTTSTTTTITSISSAPIPSTPIISIKLIAPNEISQQIGTTKSYNVTVYNNGNTRIDRVYLDITGLPKDWYSLPNPISLQVNETKVLTFTLTIPSNENPRTLIFNLTAYGEGVSDSKEIKLTLTSALTPSLPQPVCGNGICEPGEDWTNCCKDCGCPEGYECKDNACTKIPTTTTTIPAKVSPLTKLINFITSPLGIASILGILIVIGLVVFILKKKF